MVSGFHEAITLSRLCLRFDRCLINGRQYVSSNLAARAITNQAGLPGLPRDPPAGMRERGLHEKLSPLVGEW
jgi:hypothetical protein